MKKLIGALALAAMVALQPSLRFHLELGSATFPHSSLLMVMESRAAP